ncbi:hypothetical protein OG337_29010 [[Kitasatospora] papulosa]|uniref:hypothetical protein n=1 Tax=[Kitasatospora] papulosa TaxID=1464011 RepID=UPI003870CA94|nr:hypothetical protein OG337_29010 [[Kitasatospora] papulosa]
MSRSIRRVPLDFDWPQNKVWEGYLTPDKFNEIPCPDCTHGSDHPTGYSAEANAIYKTFYPHQIVHAGAWPGAHEHAQRLAWCDKLGQAEVDMLVEEGRLRTLVRREPTDDNPRNWEWGTAPRTAAEVNAANKPGAGFGGDLDHDSINHMLLARFRCKQLGITLECGSCGGECGTEAYPGQRAEAEAWEATEPPVGDGWQLWETVSEGSPISPVFPAADDLARWMSDPERGTQWVPHATAAKFIADGWAPSAVSSPETGLVSGAEWVGHHSEQ